MTSLDVPISLIQASESDSDDEPLETTELLSESAPPPSTFVDDQIGVQATGAVQNILEQAREASQIPSSEANANFSESESIPDVDIKRVADSDEEELDSSITSLSEWQQKAMHVFVLSEAGKPIYSRYGEEGRLSSIIGVMQALVSFVAAAGDELQSITAGERQFVFLRRPHLIMVAVGRVLDSKEHLYVLLNYVYSQILSLLTLQRLEMRFERQRNLDLRRLLIGDRRLISSLIDFVEDSFDAFLQAVTCVPMASHTRDSISQLIVQSVKNRDVVFAVLLHRNQIVSLVRMKGQFLHPVDLHLIVNLVGSTQALKAGQTHWIPICLPKFDANGFLYANIAYFDDHTSLALLSVDNTQFYALQEAKDAIFERLRSTNDGELLAVLGAAEMPGVRETGVPELRHLVYKHSPVGQFVATQWAAPYVDSDPDDSSCSATAATTTTTTPPTGRRRRSSASEMRTRIVTAYRRMHARLHGRARPARVIYQTTEDETFFAWKTDTFELYGTFEPFTTKSALQEIRKSLLKWITARKSHFFMLSSPTF